ncbi:kinase-like domain-containing protein [Lentinula edodes]|nr:kinase-like domain-containing protein [Lentinula edodes]
MFGQRLGWSSVFQLPFGLYVKLSQTPNEASAMEYVRTRTTIPVPAILDCPYRRWLIVMPTLPGKPVSEWEGPKLGNAPKEQLQNLQDGLADWVNQLRALAPPDPQRVSGFLGGGVQSFRINDSFTPVGPFRNPAEFHAQIFCKAYPDYPEPGDERLKRLIAERPHKDYKICFTHGDILPFNILADDELRLTGLIDWECAGWMPEYWEKAASLRSAWIRAEPWSKIIRDGFPEYEDDMILEKRIQLWFQP